MIPRDDSRLLTPPEVMAELRISRTTFYKMCKEKIIPIVREGVNGRLIRFRREDIESHKRERLVNRAPVQFRHLPIPSSPGSGFPRREIKRNRKGILK